MGVQADTDLRGLKVTLKGSKLNLAERRELLTKGAYFVLSKASRKAPVSGVGSPGLAGSQLVSAPQGNSVRFGFDRPYAEIMDRGWKTPTIRPRKAKALFIPITARGARRGPLRGDLLRLRKADGKSGMVGGKSAKRLASRRRGGVGVKGAIKPTSKSKTKKTSLKRKRSNPDFIFVKSVKTKKPVKGRRSGPNFYFSSTISEVRKSGELDKLMGITLLKILARKTI